MTQHVVTRRGFQSANGLTNGLSAAVNTGVPVADMDDAYVQSTAKLMEAIVKYATLDLYSPERVKVIDVSDRQRRAWPCASVRSGRALLAAAGQWADMLTGWPSPELIPCHITAAGLRADLPAGQMQA